MPQSGHDSCPSWLKKKWNCSRHGRRYKKLRVETRSAPGLARCYPRSFTFYVANPIRSILRGEI